MLLQPTLRELSVVVRDFRTASQLSSLCAAIGTCCPGLTSLQLNGRITRAALDSIARLPLHVLRLVDPQAWKEKEKGSGEMVIDGIIAARWLSPDDPTSATSRQRLQRGRKGSSKLALPPVIVSSSTRQSKCCRWYTRVLI
jgi:hypothetical protein